MLFFSIKEILIMVLAAIIIDFIIGDPNRRTHPVLLMGHFIKFMEKRVLKHRQGNSHKLEFVKGLVLTTVVCCFAFIFTWGLILIATMIHPWLGYVVNTWMISTTIAIKGLKDAALLVYEPLKAGLLPEARKYVGYIVGRKTDALDEREVTRAAVETVSENIVDAVVSPLFYAVIGAAPLAMMYRATNTLDSMVGYRNEMYLYFGKSSARWDDVLNWIPARLTGGCIVVCSILYPFASASMALKSILTFAHKHPSPNSGIPESAVAGALGIELGGVNDYGGVVSERARMGWPQRTMKPEDIQYSIKLLYGVSYLIAGGLCCVILLVI